MMVIYNIPNHTCDDHSGGGYDDDIDDESDGADDRTIEVVIVGMAYYWSTQWSTTGMAKVVLCTIIIDGSYIKISFAVNGKE